MDALVITGGSKGIGLAVAKLFAADGYRIVNISRSPIPLADAVQINADLSGYQWLAAAEQKIRDAVSGCARIVIVHNAGLLLKDSAVELDATTFHRVLQVNLVASVQINQLLAPMMQPGSSILYIGSTLSEKAVAGACSYISSKHAVVGLMRASCQDLAGRGIHTVCICPGFTDTEMLRAHIGNDEAVVRSLAGAVTFGRLIEPIEIARTVRFCADNAVINGAVIHANLGQFER